MQNTFQNLGLKEGLVKALTDLKIEKPSEIQSLVIPYLLNHKTDLIAQAQTGTGKTLSFGLPLLQNLKPKNGHIQGLVLAPTRELCQQIAKQLFKATKYTEKVFVEAVYGGEKIDIQIRNLQRPTQIVVATPGRLIDLLERKSLDISHVDTLILDEADEMLSMGFKDAIDTILESVNLERKIWLFSATFPVSLLRLTEKYMKLDVHKISVSKKEIVNAKIEHQFFISDAKERFSYVHKFILSQGAARGIVFCRTKDDTQMVAKRFKAENVLCDALHGDLEQRDREKVMRAFKNKKIQVLVATDISARGIDVENLSYVVHYQLPDQIEYYTHRSGRTGRAGNRGISIAFIRPDEVKTIRIIEKELGISFIKI
jgi:ATP-dependent RNA helicase DeaD